MKLRYLINDLHSTRCGKLIKYFKGCLNCEITGVCDDSRKVTTGNLYVAIKGLTHDGHKFIGQALKNGAVAIVTRKKCKLPRGISLIVVKDPRKALACLASSWYGHPSRKLKIIGVTGTKGKTTVVHLLYHIFKCCGYKTGMISTVKAVAGKKEYDTGLHVTNPEPLQIQKILSDMVGYGLEYAIVEVTSHGLDQERVYAINFDTAVLTNISREHLDYHKTFDGYRQSKLKLFKNTSHVVLNADDPSYKFFRNAIDCHDTISYSLKRKSDLSGGVVDIKNGLMRYKAGNHQGNIALTGGYNLYNILAAITTAGIYRIDTKKAVEALSGFSPPEGRLEKIKNTKGINIYIDFAHTPDSLENLLTHMNSTKNKGRLITVFGCAGERDKTKRFKMGKISGSLSDVSIITGEDPRSENVLDVSRQIKRGVVKVGAKIINNKLSEPEALKSRRQETGNSKREAANSQNKKHEFVVIPDRFEAIYCAINQIARKGDTVVVCGKGHEKSMCYGNIEHPWSDKQAITDVLKASFGKTAIVMGAGMGKRLNSHLPKVVHKLAGRPMILYTINNLRTAGYSGINVVVGYKADKVISEVGNGVNYSYQKVRLGTGHAALMGMRDISGDDKPVLVVNGDDSAFFTPQTFNEIYECHIKSKTKVTFTSMVIKDTTGLGHVIRDKKGKVLGIVEDKAATGEQKNIKEVNAAMYVFNKKWFLENIGKVKKSAVGEYYITDLVGIAIQQGDKVNVYKLKNSNEWHGVNTPEQLSDADEKMRRSVVCSM